MLRYIGRRQGPLCHALKWCAKNTNFSAGKELEVSFKASYLYLNESIGNLDFSGFDETWPRYSPDIHALNGVKLSRNSKYNSVTSRREKTTEVHV